MSQEQMLPIGGLSHEYTVCDHEHRDDDVYARTKYLITLDWLERFRTPQRMGILNVGAGSGAFSQMALEAGYQVTNLEPDPAAAALIRERLPHTRLIQDSIFGIDYTAHFDIIVVHDVLEHIRDDVAAVERCWEILGEGERPALLLVSVPRGPGSLGFMTSSWATTGATRPNLFAQLLPEDSRLSDCANVDC